MNKRHPKTTKKAAFAVLDEVRGILRNHNGGTREENAKAAPHCYARLLSATHQVEELLDHPAKRLAADTNLMDRLRSLPQRVRDFADRYAVEIAAASSDVGE